MASNDSLDKIEAPSIQELKKSGKRLKDANIEYREKLISLERLAHWITNQIGTMGFFFLIFGWTFAWFIWNIIAPQNMRFDPFPAFVLWLFISNVIQLLFLPLIMVGQNLQGRHSEARAEAEFEVNTKAEAETKAVLLHLERQNELISMVIKKLDGKK
ncbi:MAG: DUF1003 domain-containing protein [Candidatus Colwellbacteria bacterium]|nr:DUF1003 domain-containing protein [Candidatus Colwellbacteria bacterium]